MSEVLLSGRLAPLSHHSDGLSVRLLDRPADWDSMKPAWDRLFKNSPSTAPALHFEWLRLWWEIYGGTYGQSLAIFVFERHARVVGVLPMYVSRRGSLPGLRALRFLSTGEAEYEETSPEYLDLLHEEGEGEACAEALGKVLSDGSIPLAWDEFLIPEISPLSPLCKLSVSPQGGAFRVEERESGECAVADLTGGFDSYLENLSPKARKNGRRLLRAAGNASVTFDIASSNEEAALYFDDLIRLHKQRWNSQGKPGCFEAPRFTSFHRQLVKQWVPRGEAIVARLAVDQEAVGVLYGFIAGSTFHFYQCGVNTEGSGLFESPGTAILLLLMRTLADNHIGYFDFLKGRSFYKQRLTSLQHPLAHLRIVRPGWRLAMATSALSAARILRRYSREARQWLKSSPNEATVAGNPALPRGGDLQ